MPTISAHIPEDWPHFAAYKERVRVKYRGKESPYILDLVERDLEIAPLQFDHEPVTAEQWRFYRELDLKVNELAARALGALRETDPAKQAKLTRELALDLIGLSMDESELAIVAEGGSTKPPSRSEVPEKELVSGTAEVSASALKKKRPGTPTKPQSPRPVR